MTPTALDMVQGYQNSRSGFMSNFSEMPLFEALVRALERSPGKLDQVKRLIDDLRQSPDGDQLLPKDFDVIWQPVWQARQELMS
jgi:hypothetical protein